MRSRSAPAPLGRWATPRCPVDESLARHLLAHLEGGSGRSKTSPTTILQGTHSLEGVFSEVPALEPPREPSGSSVTGDDRPDSLTQPRPGTPSPQEGLQRPWWRRLLGG